jgi:hypothetical protein
MGKARDVQVQTFYGQTFSKIIIWKTKEDRKTPLRLFTEMGCEDER